jgi:hypothetical protein
MLDVRIKNNDTGAIFYLKCSDFQLSYAKNVTSVPLPGSQVFQLDLGMVSPTCKLSGQCDMTGSGGAGGIATRSDFDTILLGWLGATTYLYENSTTYYQGVIRSLNFRRDPSQDFYSWDLEFLVKLNP